jgi:hypothetical protein
LGAGTTGFDSTNAAKRKVKAGAKAASKVAKSRDLPGPAASRSSSTPAAWPAPSAGPGRQDQARRAGTSSAAYTTPVTSEVVLVAPSPPPLHRRAWAEDEPFAPLGIQLGSFILRPAIEVGGGYDTNAPRGSPATPSPYGAVAPELLINSVWARHELTASLRGSYVAYEHTPDLDRPNFEGRVNGRVDITGTTVSASELSSSSAPTIPAVRTSRQAFRDSRSTRRSAASPASRSGSIGSISQRQPALTARSMTTRTSPMARPRAMRTAIISVMAPRCALATRSLPEPSRSSKSPPIPAATTSRSMSPA